MILVSSLQKKLDDYGLDLKVQRQNRRWIATLSLRQSDLGALGIGQTVSEAVDDALKQYEAYADGEPQPRVVVRPRGGRYMS